jgi:hypothetical protein
MENLCNLLKYNLIPKEELDRVFKDSDTASAEIDLTFLCFEEGYEYIQNNTSKENIIIDFGCGYNAQCWYFKDYKRYIAVDLPFDNNVRFDSGNVEFYLMSIQTFIQEELAKLNLDLNNVIAICSAVPDTEAQEMIAETFPRYYISYPGEKVRTTIGPLKEEDIYESK